MTHKDIYTKFMIEYDKAGASTSYPSLTEYEVATVLDKAYNALIAQKVTGNNVRRATFESDIKSIADLGPLVNTAILSGTADNSIAPNIFKFDLTEDKDGNDTDLLYFLQGSMLYDGPSAFTDSDSNTHFFTTFAMIQASDYSPIDNVTEDRGVSVKLVNHEIAQKFFTSVSNIPWIKQPVCFIEGHNIFVVYDALNPPTSDFRITYIKQPNTFVKDLSEHNSGTWTYFTPDSGATTEQKKPYQFECNSTVAEELVSLAVAFALENVESQRLNSKLNMRGLEA